MDQTQGLDTQEHFLNALSIGVRLLHWSLTSEVPRFFLWAHPWMKWKLKYGKSLIKHSTLFSHNLNTHHNKLPNSLWLPDLWKGQLKQRPNLSLSLRESIGLLCRSGRSDFSRQARLPQTDYKRHRLMRVYEWLKQTQGFSCRGWTGSSVCKRCQWHHSRGRGSRDMVMYLTFGIFTLEIRHHVVCGKETCSWPRSPLWWSGLTLHSGSEW